MSRPRAAGTWVVQDQVLAGYSRDPATRMSIHIHRELADAADAQWTLTRVQERSNAIAQQQNALLASLGCDLSRSFSGIGEGLSQVSRQLGEATEHLGRIRDTQEEHLDILKRERKLKEVLFQLHSLVAELTETNDGISLLAACEHCLATLESHQLGTADLSEFADKKMFSEFVKQLRTTTRDSFAAYGEDLAAFRVSYVSFDVRLREGFRHNHPPRQKVPEWSEAPRTTPSTCSTEGEGREAWDCSRWRVPPTFASREPPEWQKRNPPLWQPHDPPALSSILQALPSRPVQPSGVVDPREAPCPLPPAMYPAGYVAPTPKNVPTQADTDVRLPPSRTWSEWFNYPKDVKCAREYEESLRKWYAAKRTYNDYLIQVKCWRQACERVTLANKELEDVTYPRMLEEHSRKEEERLAAHEAALKIFETEEEARLTEWKRRVEASEKEEQIRADKFASVMNAFKAEEQERKSAFDAQCAVMVQSNAARDDRVARERKEWQANRETHRQLLNDFLEQHSGLQEFYPRIVVPLTPPALQLPPYDQWQNNSYYAKERSKQAFAATTDEEDADVKSFFTARAATYEDPKSPDFRILVEWGRQHPQVFSRVPRMLALLEQALNSDWHHAKMGDEHGRWLWLLRASLHASAGAIEPSEAIQLYVNACDARRDQMKPAAARRLYLESHLKDPQFLWAANDYAWSMATSPEWSERDGLVAVQYALHACEHSQWHCWSFLDTLAAAYAQCGEEESAVACVRRALILCPPKDEGYVRRCIALYETGKPYPAEESEIESIELKDSEPFGKPASTNDVSRPKVEDLILSAKSDGVDLLPCPACGVEVKRQNLLKHYDKQHGASTEE